MPTSEKQKEAMRRYQRRRVEAAKAKGQCVRCNKPLDPNSTVHCPTHVQYNRDKTNAYRQKGYDARDAERSRRDEESGGFTIVPG